MDTALWLALGDAAQRAAGTPAAEYAQRLAAVADAARQPIRIIPLDEFDPADYLGHHLARRDG